MTKEDKGKMVNFFGILLSGVLASNCLVANCSGIDITTNRLKNVKNASIYSLIIFCVLFMSSLIIFLCNLILQYYGLERLLFLVTLVCVAGLVQIAEYVTKKLAPRFYLEIGYFIPILACNLFLLLLPTSFAGLDFWEMLLSVVSSGFGIWCILTIIAGIKQNYFEKVKGSVDANVASLIVVFVLIVIWTAF